jgi:hypothetical protein
MLTSALFILTIVRVFSAAMLNPNSNTGRSYDLYLICIIADDHVVDSYSPM